MRRRSPPLCPTKYSAAVLRRPLSRCSSVYISLDSERTHYQVNTTGPWREYQKTCPCRVPLIDNIVTLCDFFAQSCSGIIVSSELSSVVFEAGQGCENVKDWSKGHRKSTNRDRKITQQEKDELEVRHFNRKQKAKKGKRPVSLSTDHTRRHGETANKLAVSSFLFSADVSAIRHRISVLSMPFLLANKAPNRNIG